MRDDRQTLDLVVRDQGRLSLVLSAAQLHERLVLIGTLVDNEFQAAIRTSIKVEFSSALLEGAHVPRETTWLLDTDELESRFSWVVELVERPPDFAIQDARVTSDLGELRAFAIEDLAATVGIGLGAATAAALIWLNEKRLEKAREEAKERWQECLAEGGTPSWAFGVEADVSLDESGFPRFRARSSYQVTCAR